MHEGLQADDGERAGGAEIVDCAGGCDLVGGCVAAWEGLGEVDEVFVEDFYALEAVFGGHVEFVGKGVACETTA